MFLTREEIIELTGRKRKDAQAKALVMMGIEHKVRPNGTLAVLRSHVEQALGSRAEKQKSRNVEPNWAAISHA